MSRPLPDPRRRLVVTAGGGALLGLFLLRPARAADEIVIDLAGTPSGSEVWFNPRGLLIEPGQTVRWRNSDAANVHTTTAYHPDNGKPLRIPNGAKPWNSGYLMPGESFAVTFDTPGIYDYFCIPHEQAGMVGRIVVGATQANTSPYGNSDASLPPTALSGLPAANDIIRQKQIK